MKKVSSLILSLVITVSAAGCSPSGPKVSELKRFPVENMDEVITRSNVSFDADISKDGNGSLMVSVDEPTTIRLYEIEDVDIENARLMYQAKLRTEHVEGQVYLEMWLTFPGRGEFFSRGMHSPLSGTTEWTTQEIPFFLKKGDKPDIIKINLVVNGKGRVWIDDIRILKGPLR